MQYIKLKMVGVSYVLMGLMTSTISIVTLYLLVGFTQTSLTVSLIALAFAGGAMTRLGYMLLRSLLKRQQRMRNTWTTYVDNETTYHCFKED